MKLVQPAVTHLSSAVGSDSLTLSLPVPLSFSLSLSTDSLGLWVTPGSVCSPSHTHTQNLLLFCQHGCLELSSTELKSTFNLFISLLVQTTCMLACFRPMLTFHLRESFLLYFPFISLLHCLIPYRFLISRLWKPSWPPQCVITLLQGQLPTSRTVHLYLSHKAEHSFIRNLLFARHFLSAAGEAGGWGRGGRRLRDSIHQPAGFCSSVGATLWFIWKGCRSFRHVCSYCWQEAFENVAAKYIIILHVRVQLTPSVHHSLPIFQLAVWSKPDKRAARHQGETLLKRFTVRQQATRDAVVADEIRVTGGGVDKTSETSSLACCLQRYRGEDAEFWLICLASLKV